MRPPLSRRVAPRRTLGAAILVLAGAAAGGCVQRSVHVISSEVQVEDLRREEVARPASNLPQAFDVVTPAAVSTDCPPRLRDPGLGTMLTLRRSMLLPVQDSLGTHYRALGDYAADPRGRYGDVRAEDGLRIDCARLRALGVVSLGGGTQ
jgi:hypothetical protein